MALPASLIVRRALPILLLAGALIVVVTLQRGRVPVDVANSADPPANAPGSSPGPEATLPVAEQPPTPANTATTPVPTPQRQLLLDQYWNYFAGGNKTGWGRVHAYQVTEDGATRIELHEEFFNRTRSQIASKTRDSSTELLAWLEPDLTVISMDLQTHEAHRTSSIRVQRDPRGYEVLTALDGATQVKRLDGVGPVCGSWDLLMMNLARDGALVEGREVTFQEFDLGVPRVLNKTIRTRAVRCDAAGKVTGWDVEFDVVRAALDARGVIAQGALGGSEVVATTRADALRFDDEQVMTFQDDLNIDFTFPRYGALEEVTAEVVVPKDPDGDLFLPSEYQRVTFERRGDAGVYTLALLPYRHPEAGARAAAEPTPTDFTEYLEPTPMAQCDDPEVKERAEEVTREAKTPLEKVRALAHWVNRNLGKQYTEVAGLSARQTLREMAGDCSEHAVLFEAMARAVGVPTRECSGYVFLGEIGGRHAWSQVWVDERWQHVDCVLDCVGSDPRYVQFFQHRPNHERDLTVDRRMMRLTTQSLRAHVTSFRLWGQEWTPEAARTSARVHEGRYENPLVGLAFPVAEGWQAAEETFPLTHARLHKDRMTFEVRVLPYAEATLHESPWMLGSTPGETTWTEARIGNCDGHMASVGRAGRAMTVWTMPFEDGTVALIWQGKSGPGQDIESMLAGVEFRSAADTK